MAEENGAIGFIAGALIAYWLITPNTTIEDKSVYYQYCVADFEHNSYSCPGRTDVMEIKYKIFIERQMVVGKGGYTYKSCSVFDKNNWECDKGQSQMITMRDGDIYESNEGSIDEQGKKSSLPRYNQIWAVTYYIRSLIGFFR